MNSDLPILAVFSQEEAKTGGDTKDLGLMLCRFFRRYSGGSFNPYRHVVAVGMGGIVTRKAAERQGAEYFKNDDRLATVDPLTGALTNKWIVHHGDHTYVYLSPFMCKRAQ